MPWKDHKHSWFFYLKIVFGESIKSKTTVTICHRNKLFSMFFNSYMTKEYRAGDYETAIMVSVLEIT